MFKLLLPNKQFIQAVKRTDDNIGFPMYGTIPVYRNAYYEYLNKANGSWKLPFEWHTFWDSKGYQDNNRMLVISNKHITSDVARYQVAVMMKLKAGTTYTLGNSYKDLQSTDMCYAFYNRSNTTEEQFKSLTNTVFVVNQDISRRILYGVNFGETRTIVPEVDTVYIAGLCTQFNLQGDIITLCDPPPEVMSKREIIDNVYLEE